MSQEVALTAKQNKAVVAILAAKSLTDAAARAQVDRKTLQRWMKQPAFRAAVRAAESDMIEEATRRLGAVANDAIAALAAVIRGKAKPGDKTRAANVVLSRLLQWRELTVLEAEISDLEKQYVDPAV
jgi:hypothetical protein